MGQDARNPPGSGSAHAGESPEPQKSYVTILEQEITEGLEELRRPARGLLFSGLSAGLDVGFTALLVCLVVTLARGELAAPVYELLRANAYSVGFILVIFGRSELFTEHTTLACLPVLDGRASLTQLARLWGIVYVANLMGTVIFAGLLTVIGPALGIIDTAAFGHVASSLVDHPWWVILLSAVLAGWMMGLVSWLVTAGRDTISQIVFVWLVTSAIGLAHLHHCIAGSVEILPAVLLGVGTDLGDLLVFLGLATLGNVVGGVFFVALVKYAHATDSRRGGMHEPELWRSPDTQGPAGDRPNRDSRGDGVTGS